MASIGQSFTGPRFVETDEVPFQCTWFILTDVSHSGSTAKNHASRSSNPSYAGLSKPSKLSPSSAMVRLSSD